MIHKLHSVSVAADNTRKSHRLKEYPSLYSRYPHQPEQSVVDLTSNRDYVAFQTIVWPLVLPPAAALCSGSNGKLIHPTGRENNSLNGPSEQWMVFSSCGREIILPESLCQVSEGNVDVKCVREQDRHCVNAERTSPCDATSCDGGQDFNGSLTFGIVMGPLCTAKDQATDTG